MRNGHYLCFGVIFGVIAYGNYLCFGVIFGVKAKWTLLMFWRNIMRNSLMNIIYVLA